MKLSGTALYALLAMVQLGERRRRGAKVAGDELADGGLPAPYLKRALRMLQDREMIKSIRGRGGGYWLASPPSTLTLRQVIEAVDGEVSLSLPVVGHLTSSTRRRLTAALGDVSNGVRQRLDQVTINKLSVAPKPTEASPKKKRRRAQR